ncbi:hypothetical protein ACUWE4_05510 [Bacillus velezensis]|uniref:hypothetical protein n=1 Tax=Bacillus velezensis TaxID=492670 RepID=UPI003A804547
MSNGTESLEQLILNLDFKNAILLAEQMDLETFQIKMVNFATTEDLNILWYPFLIEYMLYHESAKLHITAFYILTLPLCSLENATLASLYHARKAFELSSGNEVEYLVPFLILNRDPEELVSEEEAKQMAFRILEIDPEHEYAKSFLNDLKG